MQMLCERMTTERDPQEFGELVRQFNALLGAKDRRLADKK